MGVIKLWEVLENIKTEVKLEDIKELTLAVDLAAWICESEGVKPMRSYVANPYLRNLFFRVSTVLKAGVKLVFVLDGKAPELKLETIARRLASSSGSPKKSGTGVRSRLNAKLKQCCVLLDTLDVPWIKAECEAEALCAELNKSGLVDGVVTNDGDAFLYGAKTVYRNFTVEKNAVIEKYSMTDIEERLNFNQRDLIALGLLLGCDYCEKGVPGVGVVQAQKLLSSFGDKDSLSVFSRWRNTGQNLSTCEVLKKPTHCSTCNHEGTKKQHRESGCSTCFRDCANSSNLQTMQCKCKWHKCVKQREIFTLEEKIKTRALEDPTFPDQNIIDEFLKNQKYLNPMKLGPIEPKEDYDFLEEHFRIKTPQLALACKYLEAKLEWKSEYSLAKVLPLLTHYLLNSSGDLNGQVQLDSIIKRRVKDHVPSLEVKWTLNSNVDISVESDTELLTIEAEEDVKKVYLIEVEKFYEDVERRKQEKKKEKADERKAQRKLKDTAGSKTAQSTQSTKMTDFFKTKKLRIVEKSSDSEPKPSTQSSEDRKKSNDNQTDVRDLESILNSLSIAQNDETESSGDNLKNDTNSISGIERDAIQYVKHKEQRVAVREGTKPIAEKISKKPTIALGGSTKAHTDQNTKKLPLLSSEKQSDNAQKLSGKAIKKTNSNCPVMIFSSDSESDDDIQDVLGSELKRLTISGSTALEQESKILDIDKEPTSNAAEITFGNELNFSLGCSLLHTPTPLSKKDTEADLSDKENTNFHHSNVNLDVFASPYLEPKSMLTVANSNCSSKNSDLALESVKTPQKTQDIKALQSGVDLADSPVFMTLMERIKARKQN